MRKKVLITGGSGLLGSNWALSIRERYDVTLLLHKRKILIDDVNTEVVLLDSLENCISIISQHNPDIIIHTAGLTSVEECEKNKKLAKNNNVDLAKNIAIVCNKLNVKLVHISTDHLFSGKNKNVTEKEALEPVNYYGKTKAEAEIEVQNRCKNALIIRTNFFGWGAKYRQSFSDSILEKLRANHSIGLFKDIFFTPILISELVIVVHKLINCKAKGVFNVVGNERLSKYEFGEKIAKHFNLNLGLINGISINDKLELMKRPRDMSLSNDNVIELLQYRIPSIDEQLKIFEKQEKNSAVNLVTLDIIPYGRHYIDDDDIKAVNDVLKNAMLTQGPKTEELEDKISSYVGSKYAVAVSSGTAALHLACLVLGLRNGDKVITSPNTFVATSNSILYVGAAPVFVDIDKKTLNIDINQVEDVIVTSKNIKAIFPIHFAGLPCDMKRIKKLANKYNLVIVEDAAHALGSIYDNGKKVGCCQYSDMTIMSFHPVKGVTAGEGGMITTNNKDIYFKLLLLRSHGIHKGNFEFPGVGLADNMLIDKEDAVEDGMLKRWYYEMQYLGYNYRITDIQCALAISQMDKIDIFLKRRKEIVAVYDKEFESCNNITPYQLHGRGKSSNHIYVVSINFKGIGVTRNQFMQKLADKGVGSQVHYIPVVSHPYYRNIGYDINKYPIMDEYYQDTLSIPLYYGLNDLDQSLVISEIKHLLG